MAGRMTRPQASTDRFASERNSPRSRAEEQHEDRDRGGWVVTLAGRRRLCRLSSPARLRPGVGHLGRPAAAALRRRALRTRPRRLGFPGVAGRISRASRARGRRSRGRASHRPAVPGHPGRPRRPSRRVTHPGRERGRSRPAGARPARAGRRRLGPARQRVAISPARDADVHPDRPPAHRSAQAADPGGRWLARKHRSSNLYDRIPAAIRGGHPRSRVGDFRIGGVPAHRCTQLPRPLRSRTRPRTGDR